MWGENVYRLPKLTDPNRSRHSLIISPHRFLGKALLGPFKHYFPTLLLKTILPFALHVKFKNTYRENAGALKTRKSCSFRKEFQSIVEDGLVNTQNACKYIVERFTHTLSLVELSCNFFFTT